MRKQILTTEKLLEIESLFFLKKYVSDFQTPIKYSPRMTCSLDFMFARESNIKSQNLETQALILIAFLNRQNKSV